MQNTVNAMRIDGSSRMWTDLANFVGDHSLKYNSSWNAIIRVDSPSDGTKKLLELSNKPCSFPDGIFLIWRGSFPRNIFGEKVFWVGKLNINVSSLFAARLSFRMPLNLRLTVPSAESQTATKMITGLIQIYLLYTIFELSQYLVCVSTVSMLKPRENRAFTIISEMFGIRFASLSRDKYFLNLIALELEEQEQGESQFTTFLFKVVVIIYPACHVCHMTQCSTANCNSACCLPPPGCCLDCSVCEPTTSK